jgi:hypothetical protein
LVKAQPVGHCKSLQRVMGRHHMVTVKALAALEAGPATTLKTNHW